MAGVLRGRRLRFTTGGTGRYEVAAVATSAVADPPFVSLGAVVRDRRSTDSRIAGTRLRRQGKGADVWRAEVPREQWDHPRDRDGVLLRKQPKTAGQLQSSFGGGYRLDVRGETWDRREDAAMALVAWYDGARSAG